MTVDIRINSREKQSPLEPGSLPWRTPIRPWFRIAPIDPEEAMIWPWPRFAGTREPSSIHR